MEPIKVFIPKRKWNIFSRVHNMVFYCRNCVNHYLERNRRFAASNNQQRNSAYHRLNVFRLLNTQSGVVTLEVLAALTILAFFTFGAIEYYVLFTKHQYAEHTMHKYKDRMRMEGFLSIASEAQLIQDFEKFGCSVEQLDGPRESQGDDRVLRTTDIEDSTVYLRITCKPEPQPLLVNRLIGSDVPGDGYRIVVGGSGLSEKVYP